MEVQLQTNFSPAPNASSKLFIVAWYSKALQYTTNIYFENISLDIQKEKQCQEEQVIKEGCVGGDEGVVS